MTATLTTRDSLDRLRPQIEAALFYSGGTHSFSDVVEAIERGVMQCWDATNSVVITELISNPSGRKDLHFFLAAGNEAELKTLHPMILAWGISEGCTHATIIGRHGWQRSWLTRDLGWLPTLTVFERGLTVGKK